MDGALVALPLGVTKTEIKESDEEVHGRADEHMGRSDVHLRKVEELWLN